MQQIIKELPTGILMFQEVEPNWSDFRVFQENGHTRLMINKVKVIDGIEFPDFSFINLNINEVVDWQLLGSSANLTEEQLQEVMPKYHEVEEILGDIYVDCNHKNIWHNTALESYNSLKEGLGVVDECNCSDEDSHNCYKCLKIKPYQVLYKKN